VTHEEVGQTFLEDDVPTIIRNLENPPENRIEYYEVQFNGPTFQATLHPVNLKAGPRTAAPAREIAELEANGQTVRSNRRLGHLGGLTWVKAAHFAITGASRAPSKTPRRVRRMKVGSYRAAA
jgi:hypothetical protein